VSDQGQSREALGKKRCTRGGKGLPGRINPDSRGEGAGKAQVKEGRKRGLEERRGGNVPFLRKFSRGAGKPPQRLALRGFSKNKTRAGLAGKGTVHFGSVHEGRKHNKNR